MDFLRLYFWVWVLGLPVLLSWFPSLQLCRHHLLANLNPTHTATSISEYPKAAILYSGTPAVNLICDKSYDQ